MYFYGQKVNNSNFPVLVVRHTISSTKTQPYRHLHPPFSYKKFHCSNHYHHFLEINLKQSSFNNQSRSNIFIPCTINFQSIFRFNYCLNFSLLYDFVFNFFFFFPLCYYLYFWPCFTRWHLILFQL